MLHNKFQGSRPYGSPEGYFEAFYHIYGHNDHPGHLTWTKRIHFHFLFAYTLMEGRIAPVLRPWIRSAEVWGNVAMSIGTQQQQPEGCV